MLPVEIRAGNDPVQLRQEYGRDLLMLVGRRSLQMTQINRAIFIPGSEPGIVASFLYRSGKPEPDPTAVVSVRLTPRVSWTWFLPT
jgi:hypothetical protein